MLTLADIRDYVASLGITTDANVYCGKLDDKKQQSIGIYHLKQNRPPLQGIGADTSYNTKGISLLVHWSKSPRTTETVAQQLYDALKQCKDVTINSNKIKFIEHLYNEPISIDTDDNGIYEFVIECYFYVER